MSFLAISALLGIGAAFANKPAVKKVSGAKLVSRYYGVTGVTSGNNRYTAEVYDVENKFCDAGQVSFTCCFKYTSIGVMTTVTKSQAGDPCYHSKYVLL